MYIVAPLVGAWIEIHGLEYILLVIRSLPSWERGLKYCDLFPNEVVGLSLPSWERGLKYVAYQSLKKQYCRSPRGSVD